VKGAKKAQRSGTFLKKALPQCGAEGGPYFRNTPLRGHYPIQKNWGMFFFSSFFPMTPSGYERKNMEKRKEKVECLEK